MSGVRRSERLLARFEEVTGDNGGVETLTQLEQEHAGAMGITCCEVDTVVAEEAEVAKEDAAPQTTLREVRKTG
jgi:hypothetical protein